MKTVAFKTLGCKVNQYETQAMREQFLRAGFREVPWDRPADLYIVNTCTVTERADSESRRLIRVAGKENPGSKIVATGCYTELDRPEIEKITGNLLIVKNSEKDKILQQFLPTASPQRDPGISAFEGRARAFVKVQDGCDNFCSYCRVPLARGRSRSREADEIISEINQLVSNGYKEVILTGICLGDWGRDLGLKFADLLGSIGQNTTGDFRVRLSSVEPWYVTGELLRKISGSKTFCRHLHIPMQSGDDETLKRMNRRFTSKDFIGLIGKARLLMPDIAFTTDVIVGFPGETDEHFNNTLRTVEVARPSRTHIFPFSRRPGTRAAGFTETVPANAVKDRVKRLKALTDRLALEYRERFKGRPVEVLVETRRSARTGLLTGYTDTYIKVAFLGPDELKGQIRVLTLTN